MRIARIVLVYGLVFVILSFLPGTVAYGGGVASEGSYVGTTFRALNDIWVEVDTDNETCHFSLYLLDYENTNRALQDGNLDDTEFLVAHTDIVTFSGVIRIPYSGVYSLVLTTQADFLWVYIRVTAVVPRIQLLVAGGGLILVVVVVMGFCTVIFGRKQKLDIINRIQSKRKGD